MVTLHHSNKRIGAAGLPTLLLLFLVYAGQAQNVGIGTSQPLAALHVADSSVVFTSGNILSSNPPAAPVNGAGGRMMWYASKAAFRAGYVNGYQWNAENLGKFSFALGQNVMASGDASGAFGISSDATGYNSIAMGNSASASGSLSMALGSNTSATAMNAVAIGYYAAAHQNYATAIGPATTANAVSAMAIGLGTDARTLGQTSLGSYNQVVNGDIGTWIPADPLLVVGNGTSNASRSTALTILKNGNVGIGLLNPQAKLQVNGQVIIGTGTPQATLHVEGNQIIRRNSYTGSAHLVLEETQSGDGARLQMRNDLVNNAYWEVYGKPDASNSADAWFNIYYESVGNAMAMRGNGNVSFRGSVSQNSDVRLKKDIEPLQHSAEKLEQLRGYRYHWKNEKQDRQWQTGLLAQEVEQVFPELVSTDADGMKTVNYTALIPHLIESIRQLQQRVRLLEKQ